MTEDIDPHLLHQAVQAQSRLIAELMDMFHANDLRMTSDEGHEMLLRATENMDRAALMHGYLDPIRASFPAHSTEG